MRVITMRLMLAMLVLIAGLLLTAQQPYPGPPTPAPYPAPTAAETTTTAVDLVIVSAETAPSADGPVDWLIVLAVIGGFLMFARKQGGHHGAA